MKNWLRLVTYTLLLATIWGLIPLPVSAQPFLPPHQTPMAIFSFSGTRPQDLGLQNGQLAACPNSPNCVSSQAPVSDAIHYIAPLTFSGSAPAAIAQLKTLIEGLERTQIVQANETYLYAEFTSKLMGFVDDVEFYADDGAKVIHVRSASRLGQSDLGANRDRIEALRAAAQQVNL
ncbi:MAG: DUF1499 domain-containing protein [Thermosynechococcaceae cyanobacterium]